MKHLKRFNESNIDRNLEEICYDLTDTGKFRITFKESKEVNLRNDLNLGNSKMLVCYILISPFSINDIFSINDVDDVILRLKDYLGDKYIKTMMMKRNGVWCDISYDDKIVSNIYHIMVIYKS